jgi:hypothetical protein
VLGGGSKWGGRRESEYSDEFCISVGKYNNLVEIILRSREGEMMENYIVESNKVYCKHIYKCYNVFLPLTTIYAKKFS